MDSTGGARLHARAPEVGDVMPKPHRIVGSALVAATSLAVGVVITAQQPRIANGRVTAQPAGSPFAQSFRSLVSSQTDVAWLGYAVPVVDSERIMCCFSGDTTWINGNVVSSDGGGCCRACRLEPSADGTSMATRAPGGTGTGVVRLEPSDRMVVLFRDRRSRRRSDPRVLGRLRARRRGTDGHLARRRSARPTAWRSSNRSPRRPTAGAIACHRRRDISHRAAR